MRPGMIVLSAVSYRMIGLEVIVVVVVVVHRVTIRERDRFRTGQGRRVLRICCGGGAVCPAHEVAEARDGAIALDDLRQLVLCFLV